MENLKLCKECKGVCCKSMGCHYSPEDFKDLSFESLKKEIDKGYISIDWWEGNPFYDDREIEKAYYLRIKNVGANTIDPSWGGKCMLLTDNGCTLTYNKRPKGGRMLIPKQNKRCEVKYGKQEAARDWYKHRDILNKLVNHYKEAEKELKKKNEEYINKELEMFKDYINGRLNNSTESISIKNNDRLSELEINFKENQSKEDTEIIKDFLFDLFKGLE